MKRERKKEPGEDRLFRRRLVTTIIAVSVTLIVLLLLWYAAQVFLLLFAGILLGIFLRGLARFFSRKSGLSINWSLPIVLVLLTALIVGSVLFLAPQVTEQVSTLSETLPKSISAVQEEMGKSEWGSWILEQLPDGSSSIASGNFVSGVTGFFSSTLGVLANIVLVLIIGIYLAVNPEPYRNGLIKLFPKRMRPKAEQVVYEATFTLHWWLIGQIAAMILVGVLTTIGLVLLGIPLAFTLGLLAALLTFIPNFGPIISVVPPALLGLMISPAHMLYVVLLYLGIQTVESYLITPQIHKRTLSLPPVITLTTQILFGILFGFPGLLLATPLTALGLVLLKMVYVEEVLEDDVELPSESHHEG